MYYAMYVCVYIFCIHEQIIRNKHNMRLTMTSLYTKTDSDNSVHLT